MFIVPNISVVVSAHLPASVVTPDNSQPHTLLVKSTILNTLYLEPKQPWPPSCCPLSLQDQSQHTSNVSTTRQSNVHLATQATKACVLILPGDRQLCLPGTPFELTEAVIDGRKQKVWKNVSTLARSDHEHRLVRSPPRPLPLTTVRALTPQLPISWRDVIRGGCAKFAERTMLSSPVPEPCDFYAREYVTFAQAYQQALQLAGALREQGVGVEDRVAVGGLNSTG